MPLPKVEHTDVTDVPSMKYVHRNFMTGVTIVTTMVEGTPRGLAVNAFSCLSLDPPLIMVCVQRTSSTFQSLFQTNSIGVSILAANQTDIVRRFASKSNEKFAGDFWSIGENGAPLIDGASATIEAEIQERLQASTHTVFIARVTRTGHTDNDPIVYSVGRLFDSSGLKPIE